LEIRLTEAGGRVKEFRIELTNDKILTPLLLNMTVASLLSSEERSIGDISYALDGDVYLDNGTGVHLEDLFTGNLDAAATGLSGLLTAVVYFLNNNEFQPVGIHRITLNVRSVEEARFSFLERVWLDKYEVSAGERIQVKVYGRAFGGQSFEQEAVIGPPSGGLRVPSDHRRRRLHPPTRDTPVPEPGFHAAQPGTVDTHPQQPAQEQPHLFQDAGRQTGALPEGGGAAEPAAVDEIPVRFSQGRCLRPNGADPVHPPGISVAHSLRFPGDGLDSRQDQEIGDWG
jgi:hypothetical protein